MEPQFVSHDEMKIIEENIISKLKEMFLESTGLSNKWLTTTDVRNIFGMSFGKQQIMRDEGKLPFSKIGETVYYSIYDIDNILEANKVTRSPNHKNKKIGNGLLTQHDLDRLKNV